MKLRETYLKSLIHEMFGEGNKEEFKFSYNQLSSKGQAEMKRIYQSLGGILM